MPKGTKNTIIQGCGTHHLAVQARDWDASLRFYRDVLGMTEAASFTGGTGQRIMLLDIGDGSHIELFEPLHEPSLEPRLEQPSEPGSTAPTAGDDPTSALLHFAFATADARAATEHVRDAGYEITVEPKEVNLGGLEVTVAFFKGPSGELLEFFQVHDR